ncbi:MAG TPA: hypothetical protein VHX19_06540 [Stellaceae bacterium]|jgi:hypothetical protein|nr:hypothetical protein [Stellaceae bacterium]
MRTIAGVLVITAALSVSSAPLVRAQGQNDSSPSSQHDSQGHVKQHQDLLPPSASQNGQKDSDQSKRDQSAQAPQSPAVITPPSTGDKSVITPPNTGAANTPVIAPPGAPGSKDDIQPK